MAAQSSPCKASSASASLQMMLIHGADDVKCTGTLEELDELDDDDIPPTCSELNSSRRNK